MQCNTSGEQAGLAMRQKMMMGQAGMSTAGVAALEQLKKTAGGSSAASLVVLEPGLRR